MKDKCKVAIIIVNFNGNDDTLECLKSIDNTILLQNDVKYEVILVDNGSTKPIMLEDIGGIVSKIHLVPSPKNLGFAGGNILGLQYINEQGITFDMVLLLNNDTVLVDDSISRLAIRLINSSYGIGGVVNYYYSNPKEIWQAGNIVQPSRLKGKSIKSDVDGNDFVKSDFVPGSSMMIKKEVIDKVGFLDARYFAYFEESDLSIRAAKAGYTTAFLQGTKILHKVGKTSPSVLKHYLRTRNTLLFYEKNFPQLMYMAKIRIILRSLSVFFASRCSFKYLKAYRVGKTDYMNRVFFEGHISLFKQL